jgi:hypothetical protein
LKRGKKLEKYFKVKPIGVNFMCKTCKDGEMIATGKMKLSEPPKFTHKCSKCENEEDFNEKYPLIRYEFL